MTDSNLSTTSGTGAQNNTQDPQTAGNSAASGSPTASVQPGIVGSLDSGTGGVPLTSQSLPTIALTPTTASVVTVAPVALPQHHHFGSLLIGISIILFIAAVALVATTFLPAKNTTK